MYFNEVPLNGEEKDLTAYLTMVVDVKNRSKGINSTERLFKTYVERVFFNACENSPEHFRNLLRRNRITLLDSTEFEGADIEID